MDTDFWLTRWQNNEIGFHKTEPNRYLRRFVDRLASPEQPIFLPLCGKSVDLAWLAQRGARSIGVEVCELACRAFFEESNQTAKVTQEGNFRVYHSSETTIYCGDFFDLPPSVVTNASGVFDRGALVALPSKMRQHYAQHMSALLARGVRMLLVAIEYKQSEMNGPPFAVMETEVRELYSEHFDIELLLTDDVLADNPHIQQRGVQSFVEKVYLLERR